ncbi:hypothetical protein A7U60_g4730 [Sanghuangporus baumii]|uniref:Uncharacterized protein n=1 Tax=Sanghuangporus baumii TaxID=108892 RepID=A0A9Q5HY23_SANBA|nr:hypothetical protein A7U60_g4730 [Sanghuangporus baumii]
MNVNGTHGLEGVTPGLFVTSIILLCHHSTVLQDVVTVRTERTRTVVHYHVGAAGSTSPGAEIKADMHISTKVKKIKNANIMAVVTKALIIDHPCSHCVADVATTPMTIHGQDLLAEANTTAATEKYEREARVDLTSGARGYVHTRQLRKKIGEDNAALGQAPAQVQVPPRTSSSYESSSTDGHQTKGKDKRRESSPKRNKKSKSKAKLQVLQSSDLKEKSCEQFLVADN